MADMAWGLDTFLLNWRHKAPDASTTEGSTEPTAENPPPQTQGDELD